MMDLLERQGNRYEIDLGENYKCGKLTVLEYQLCGVCSRVARLNRTKGNIESQTTSEELLMFIIAKLFFHKLE